MIRNGDPIQVNFGGFVSLSTIDWRGKAVCTVFLRGCPLRCSYCQNEAIQTGEDFRDLEEIVSMIKTSAPFISGVVFSGGEPTAQRDALIALATKAKAMGLAVGLQTNGLFPDTLQEMIVNGLVDKIAIDYKTQWEGFSVREDSGCATQQGNYQKKVSRSIQICRDAYENHKLAEFEVVLTVFYENGKYLKPFSDAIGNIPLVLQQGEHKIPMMPDDVLNMTGYIAKKQTEKEHYTPMTLAEIQKIAESLKRDVRIRTREVGEIACNRRFML
jgi:pyruvate formate lyase activating enzyme